MAQLTVAPGMTKRERKRINANSHSEKTRYRQVKFVCYCPYCSPERANLPHLAPRIGVNPVRPGAVGKCKAGHVWEIKRKVRL